MTKLNTRIKSSCNIEQINYDIDSLLEKQVSFETELEELKIEFKETDTDCDRYYREIKIIVEKAQRLKTTANNNKTKTKKKYKQLNDCFDKQKAKAKSIISEIEKDKANKEDLSKLKNQQYVNSQNAILTIESQKKTVQKDKIKTETKADIFTAEINSLIRIIYYQLNSKKIDSTLSPKNLPSYSTFIYAAICTIGMITSWVNYKTFGVNIFNYAIIPDFFISGIVELRVLLPCIFIVVLFYGFMIMVRKRTKSYRWQYCGNFIFNNGLLTISILFLLLIAIPQLLIAISNVTKKNNFKTNTYSIYNTPPLTDLEEVYLIGMTTDFAFYKPTELNKKDGLAIIIPKNKILAIEKHKTGEKIEKSFLNRFYPYSDISKSIEKLKSIKAQVETPISISISPENYSSPPSQASQNIYKLIQEYIERTINTEMSRKKNFNIKDGELVVSHPIYFRPNAKLLEEKEKDICLKIIRKFLPYSIEVSHLFIIGLASPEGPLRSNMELSQKRAEHIRDTIYKLAEDEGFDYLRRIKIKPVGLGEDHTLNGISDSRSAYLAYITTPVLKQTKVSMMSIGASSKKDTNVIENKLNSSQNKKF